MFRLSAQDVRFFCDALSATGHPPTWLVLNRAVDERPGWTLRLATCSSASESLRHAAALADRELATQARRTTELRRAVTEHQPNMHQVSIAKLDASDPIEVARAAADKLDILLGAARVESAAG